MSYYCLLAQLLHLQDLHEQLPGVEHEVQLSPQLRVDRGQTAEYASERRPGRCHETHVHEPPLLAWFLGGHPAHLQESQEQAWALDPPQLLQLVSQLAVSTRETSGSGSAERQVVVVTHLQAIVEIIRVGCLGKLAAVDRFGCEIRLK